MKWYYKVMGGHTHVRVFMNGAKCGDLCFRNEEFRLIREQLQGAFAPPPSNSKIITFIEETNGTQDH